MAKDFQVTAKKMQATTLTMSGTAVNAFVILVYEIRMSESYSILQLNNLLGKWMNQIAIGRSIFIDRKDSPMEITTENRLTKVEESAKSAHHRLDRLEGQSLRNQRTGAVGQHARSVG